MFIMAGLSSKPTKSCMAWRGGLFRAIGAERQPSHSAINLRGVVAIPYQCDRLHDNLRETVFMSEALDDVLIMKLANWNNEQAAAAVNAIVALRTIIGERLASFTLRFIENRKAANADSIRAFLADPPPNAEARSIISFLIRESCGWELHELNKPRTDLDTWMAQHIFTNNSTQWAGSERALVVMRLVSFHSAKLKAATERGVAQEVLSKVLLGIIEGRGAYTYKPKSGQTPVDAFLRYIWRSIANGGIDIGRTTQRNTKATAQIISDTEVLGSLQSASRASPEEILLKAEQKLEAQRLVHAALAALSPENRELVVRKCFLEQSYSQIAADCGENEAAIRKRYSRALAQLRELLGEHGASADV
jgi:RNA polymerase sigma factor (sigma-70 family)